MKLVNTGVWIALVIILGACSTVSGPIKGYDASTNIDTRSLSRIYLPPEIDVLKVDGVEVETPYITEGFNEIHLLPGMHTITVRYERFWGDGTTGSTVKSKPVTLGLQIKAASEYTMNFPKVEDVWQASSMVKKFNPWLEDKKGGKLATKRIVPGTNLAVTSGGPALSAEEIVARQKPLEKLQFWWKLADKKDRKEFRRWIVEN